MVLYEGYVTTVPMVASLHTLFKATVGRIEKRAD